MRDEDPSPLTLEKQRLLPPAAIVAIICSFIAASSSTPTPFGNRMPIDQQSL
jgi:hypothetical protein